MQASNIQYKLAGDVLTITCKLSDPAPSASQKTMVVASTAGNKPTGVSHNGHELVAGINIYFKPGAAAPAAMASK